MGPTLTADHQLDGSCTSTLGTAVKVQRRMNLCASNIPIGMINIFLDLPTTSTGEKSWNLSILARQTHDSEFGTAH